MHLSTPLRRLPARALVLLLLLLWLPRVPSGVSAATANPAPAQTGQPPGRVVLTSFLPVFSWTASIAGDRVRVENWLPTGVDPHDFQLAPRDVRRLREAQALVLIGLGLENWRESNLRRLSGNPDLRLFEASRGVAAGQLIQDTSPHVHGEDHDHDHDPGQAQDPGRAATNPHFWLDPLLASAAVTNILQALVELDPQGVEIYRRNADQLQSSLVKLHQDYEAALAPVRQTPFLTLHNAFPYLARRYQLRLVGVLENTGKEDPSARELAALSATVRRERARVLFVDGRSSRLALRLAADLGLEIATLETLETGKLTPQAYEEGMRRNLETLRRALLPRPPR